MHMAYGGGQLLVHVQVLVHVVAWLRHTLSCMYGVA